MPSRNIVIFTPMQIEAKAIRRGLESVTGITVPVYVIGIKATLLPSPADIARGSAIILAGFAGALNPSLNVGDLVLDGYSDVTGLASVHAGRIQGSDQLIYTVTEKAELFTQTAASAVDMESATVRQFAAEIGCDVIGLRAISDRADEAVDRMLINLVDSTGRPRLARIAGQILRHPSLLGRLLKLGRGARTAARSLSSGIAMLVIELSR